MESPRNPMMITGVLWFDGELSLDELTALLAERLVEAYPKFRMRIVDAIGPAPPRWVDDPHFHLANHVRHVALPEPGGAEGLRLLVSDLASHVLDLRFSPWQFHLVDDVEGGSALIGRIHHSMADGISLARVLFSLTDARGRLPESHPLVVRRSWADVPMLAVKATAEAVEAVAEAILEPQRLAHVLDLGVEGAAELEYLLTLPADAATPLRSPLGVRKQVAWAGPIPLVDVKVVGSTTGCTVNDVLVSAMAGALGAHLRAVGHPVDRIRCFVPVNLRPLDEPVPKELGNQLSMVILSMPVGETDPLARLNAVHAEMERLKQSIEPGLVWALLELLGMTPALVERWLIQWYGAKASAVFTNVPGPRKVVSMGGVPMKRVMVWVPQTGPIGLGLSIFSYAGEVTVGVSADEHCLPDPQGLADRFAVAFDELRQAALA